jgi:hypothetical protein
MSSFKNLSVSATCLLRAAFLKSKNIEASAYVTAWLLSRCWKKDSELLMSSPGFGENLPCPAHMGSMFFKSARSAGDELFRKQPVRHRCLCLSVGLWYPSKNHTQLQHESAEDANSRSHILFFLPTSDFNLKRYLADAMTLPSTSPSSHTLKRYRELYMTPLLASSPRTTRTSAPHYMAPPGFSKIRKEDLMICVFFRNAVLAKI